VAAAAGRLDSRRLSYLADARRARRHARLCSNRQPGSRPVQPTMGTEPMPQGPVRAHVAADLQRESSSIPPRTGPVGAALSLLVARLTSSTT